MKIIEVKSFSLRVFNAVSGLLPQLAPGSEPLINERFKKILKSEGTYFFIVEHENKIIGMMVIVSYNVPTATRFWIEDVVVDESQRGKGFGKELIKFAIDFARSKGAKTIDLTSRPHRIAANQLYQKMGFAIRQTNVYRYIIK